MLSDVTDKLIAVSAGHVETHHQSDVDNILMLLLLLLLLLWKADRDAADIASYMFKK